MPVKKKGYQRQQITQSQQDAKDEANRRELDNILDEQKRKLRER